MTINSFLVVGFLVWFLFFFLPLHLVLWLIGKKNLEKKFKISHKIIDWAFGCCIFFNQVKIDIYNQDLVPNDEPILFVPNHRSYWDILVLHNSIKAPVGFVAKVEMKKVPLLNWWMEDIGCVFLDRVNPKEGLKAILQGADYLKNGHCMVLCPEGTRNHNDDMLPFKEGSLKMAEKAKCKIVPVALIGTDDLLEKNPKFKMYKGNVKVVFGEPFYVSDIPAEYKKKSAAYAQTKVQALLDEYKNK